jgi:hypothetical protein
MRKQLPFSVWSATKSQLQTWLGAQPDARSAVEIPKRFMRRCFLLALIPSSLRIRATRFALTSLRM